MTPFWKEFAIIPTIYRQNQEYLIFAMQDGCIRVNKLNPDDYTDLTNHFTVILNLLKYLRKNSVKHSDCNARQPKRFRSEAVLQLRWKVPIQLRSWWKYFLL